MNEHSECIGIILTKLSESPSNLAKWTVYISVATFLLGKFAQTVMSDHFVAFLRVVRDASLNAAHWTNSNLKHPAPSSSNRIVMSFAITLTFYCIIGALLLYSFLLMLGILTQDIPPLTLSTAMFTQLVLLAGAQYYRVEVYKERMRLRQLTAGTWLGRSVRLYWKRH